MPYPFLGVTGRSYVQYTDEATGRMLITEPGGTYDHAARTRSRERPRTPRRRPLGHRRGNGWRARRGSTRLPGQQLSEQ